MSIGWLVAGLVLAFVVLDVLVAIYLFRRAARRAAAWHVPSPRVSAGRPRRGAFGLDDALTWTSSERRPSAAPDDDSLTWTDGLDGFTDLSRSDRDGDTLAAGQSSPRASSKAE